MTTKINVRPSELTMPVYQRTPNPARVNKIARDFDPDAIGAVTLARREDGTFVVIDGGHRVGACRTLGYNEKILAIVHDGLTIAEEAALFLSLNDVKAVGLVDKHRASVYAEVPDALTVDKIVTRHGWEVHKNAGNGRINAVGALYSALKIRKDRKEGEAILDATLAIITGAWGLDKEASQKPLIEGIAKVLHRYPDADRARIQQVLSAQLPRSVQLHGEMAADVSGWTVGSGVASVVVNHYNNRLRTGRLDPWIWKN